MSLPLTVALFDTLLACVNPFKEFPPYSTTDTGPTPTGTDTATYTTGTTTAAAPCADGSWGTLPKDQEANAIFVSQNKSPNPDGTEQNPFSLFSDAIDFVETNPTKTIFLGPGTYSDLSNLIETSSKYPTGFDGLSIYGCSPTESIVNGEGMYSATLGLVNVANFHLEGFSVIPPKSIFYGLAVFNPNSQGTIDNVTISGPAFTGLYVQDGGTLDITNSSISTTDGMGLQVETTDQVTITNSKISAKDEGVWIRKSSFSATNLTIDQTGDAGIECLVDSNCEITDSVITNATLTGIRATDAKLLSVSNTTIGPVAVSAGTQGDGIVCSQGEYTSVDPRLFRCDIHDVTINTPARAGVIFDNVTGLSCTNIIVTGAGYYSNTGLSVFSQNGANMSCDPADYFPIKPGRDLSIW